MPARRSSSAAAPRTGPAKVTDVARLAGVSLATVSRAFNAPELLGAQTLDRVREAARKLDYLPYGLARSLRRRRAMVIGMVIPSLTNVYFAGTVERIQSLVARRGYTMLLASSSHDPETEINAVKAMIGQGVDGMILFGRLQNPESAAALRRAGVPYLRSWVAAPGEPYVAFDHDRAMRKVARHLLALGHRVFAAIMPFKVLGDTRRSRLEAVREELASDGVALAAEAVVDDLDLGIAAGRAAFRRVLERAPLATAVICSNDNLAAGAILEAQACGLEVPRDVSVTGYNDLEIASAMSPAITTVRTPMSEHAELVVAALLDSIASGEAAPSRMLETELVVRASTAAPARRGRAKQSR